MIKFSKIQGFSNAVKHARKHADQFMGETVFEGTVKLHGTNAGILVGPNSYQPQSRSRVLTLQQDNYGFAAWAFRSDVKEAIRRTASNILYFNDLPEDTEIVVYGEWTGPGIQKNVAVNGLPERQFVIFAAGIPTPDDEEHDRKYLAITNCEYDQICVTSFPEVNVRAIWEAGQHRVTVDLMNPKSCTEAAEIFNRLTAEVDQQCPWGALHDLKGHGEGMVWKPIGERTHESDLFFKVKGESHAKGGAKEARTRSPAPPGVDAFVEYACTDARLNQGIEALKEMGKPIEMPSTGDYMRWVQSDVAEECADELVEAHLEWKQVQRGVAARALLFWKVAVAAA